MEGLPSGFYNVQIRLGQKITILGRAELSLEAEPTSAIEIPIPFPGYGNYRLLDAKARPRMSSNNFVRVLGYPAFMKALCGTVVDSTGAVIPGGKFILTDVQEELVHRKMPRCAECRRPL